ncbi:MAG: DUF4281 domain-containing protein [Amylibacter sp.]|jgi:hypothetical protein|nr:DUF4281 domain-containing protein [Amylibacter sp.]
MSPDLLFYAIHLPIFPAWALLAVAPRWRGTRFFVHSALIPLILGALYSTLLARGIMGESTPGAGFNSLPAVMALFAHPIGALNSWTHFLIFDLFIGAWISRDAIRHNIGQIATLPFLFFALMFAPLGLALWLLFKGITGRGWSLQETSQ